MQFGHDDPATAESSGQKNRSGSGLKGVSIFVPFEYNSFPRATQLISSNVFKRYALHRIVAGNCRWLYTKGGTGIAVLLSSRRKNLCRAFLRTNPSEQRRFEKWSLNEAVLETSSRRNLC